MEVAPAFQPRLEDYECAICKDLVFKPAVNVCQHIFCFWCLHQSMNNVSESNCPLCRREYGHLARTCGLLHFFLGSAFPLEYRARQAEVLADDERREIAAEDLEADPVLLDAPPSVPDAPSRTPETPIQNPQNPSLDGPSTSYSSSPTHIGSTTDKNGHATEGSVVARRPYPFSGPGTKYPFRGVDFGCKLCQRLLHEPTVLVCGHVFCLPCIRTRSSDPRCPVCRVMQSNDPHSMVSCAPIADLVAKAFPHEAAARARETAAESATVSTKAAEGPSPERPPTVQVAMSRARTLLLSAHADLVRRGEPFNLRAVTERLLQELDPKYVVHFGVGCDGCGQSPIVGDRFQCSDCQERLGFDMCGHCHDMETPVRGLFDQRHTREHRVAKIFPVDAVSSRHFGIDPYRVLFTNPELPYQSVQRMRDDMRDEGELEFFLSELEETESPRSPDIGPLEDAPGSWPGLDYTPTRANHVDFYPSPAVFPSFEDLSTDGPGARQNAGRSGASPSSPRGTASASRTMQLLENVRSAERGVERLAPGERSPVGGRIWAHRVGGERGRGAPTGSASRVGAVAGRSGPNGEVPGLSHPGRLRRADPDWFARGWVEAMMPPNNESDGPAVDWASSIGSGTTVAAQEVRASANENGNGSGNGQEAVRGEWHDVHEGGVGGQERPRPATAFGQRRLRRSFGRRHILPYRLPYPEDSPDTRRTFGNAERTGDSGPQDALVGVTSQEEPSSSVGGGDETQGADIEMSVTDADPFPGDLTQANAANFERPRILRVLEVPSPEPLPESRSVLESDQALEGTPWRNYRPSREPGYTPRSSSQARRSMDGLPPLPPRRRSLSAFPLERTAGLLMLTLASTAAEHPSFEGASRSSVERNREDRYRLLERNAPHATRGSFPGPMFEEVFAAAAEPVDQQLLADFATQFDSERTVQDMQTGDLPAGVPPEHSLANIPLAEFLIPDDPDDVIRHSGGLETPGEATPHGGAEPANHTPATQTAANQTAGVVTENGGSDVTAVTAAQQTPVTLGRQGYSLVDSLVRALGGQRRRPRDGQPEASEASPSQVRRLRRPEE